MQVKRLVRPDATTVLTDDGYLYEWSEGGEAVDVLEHHRRALLAAKGAHLVEVEVVDDPVILPTLPPVEPLSLATVPPPEREPDQDLSHLDVPKADLPQAKPLALATVQPVERPDDLDLTGAKVRAPVLPDDEPITLATVPAASRPDDADLTGATVEPAEKPTTAPLTLATVYAQPRPADQIATPVVSDQWTDEDIRRADEQKGV